MASAGRLALAIVTTVVVVVTTYKAAHKAASRSDRARKWLMGGNGAAVVLGLIAALWLPSRVPDTGSAATIVAIVLLWIVGGGLALMGGVAFLGAMMARPEA